MTEAYPLQWPDGWPRTEAHKRQDGRNRFRRGDWRDRYYWTVHTATQTLLEELNRLGATPGKTVISTNMELRLDGLPKSGRRAPDDPGVATYFELGGEPMVMARDAFDGVAENIRSLALAVEALRQLERHGGGTMLKRAFTGFQALPPPSAGSTIVTPNPWWVDLGLDERPDNFPAARTAWRGAMMKAHPDHGGSTDAVERVNAAFERARAEFGDG